MNKNTLFGMIATVLVVVAAVIILAGYTGFDGVGPDPASNGNDGLPAYVEGANTGEVVDATGMSDFEITIDDNIFEQTYVTVSTGTTVTWVNNGLMQHDVVSDDSSPSQGLASPLLRNGETYSYTFDEAGTYNYYCRPHPFQMKAVIEVVG